MKKTEHSLRRDHHHRSRVDAAVDDNKELFARSCRKTGVARVDLRRGQYLAEDRRQQLFSQRRGTSDADPQGRTAARSALFPEVGEVTAEGVAQALGAAPAFARSPKTDRMEFICRGRGAFEETANDEKGNGRNPRPHRPRHSHGQFDAPLLDTDLAVERNRRAGWSASAGTDSRRETSRVSRYRRRGRLDRRILFTSRRFALL